MLLLVDNYDSFTFNLYQMIGALYPRIEVVRNDRITLDEVDAAGFDGIILSPGPGTPDDSGVCLDILERLEGRVPILGVCLGHQAICQARGARIERARVPVHGKPSPIDHDSKGLFAGLETPFIAGRYHSLIVAAESLPEELHVTAKTDEGEIMGVRHATNPTWGVQFHPESILTPDGDQLLKNFLALMEKYHAA